MPGKVNASGPSRVGREAVGMDLPGCWGAGGGMRGGGRACPGACSGGWRSPRGEGWTRPLAAQSGGWCSRADLGQSKLPWRARIHQTNSHQGASGLSQGMEGGGEGDGGGIGGVEGEGETLQF